MRMDWFTIEDYEEHQKYLKDVYEKENLWEK